MDPMNLANGTNRTAQLGEQARKSYPMNKSGLVSFTPAEPEIKEVESGVDTTLDNPLIASSELAGYITQQWETNRNGRDVLNARLVRCLAAVKGEYSTDQITVLGKGFGSSTIFYKLTGTKTNAAGSWIREIMMPPGDRAWGLEPTTLPELPPAEDQQVRQAVFDAVLKVQEETGQELSLEDAPKILERALDAALHEVREFAKKRAGRMSDKMNDMMQEGRWNTAFSEYIDHFVTYPTAILKGPIMARHKSLKWGPDGKPIVESKEGVTWRAVNPFDCYPAPQADSAQDGSFIERIRLTRAELYGYIGVRGYNEEAIRKALQLHGAGMLTHWLETEGERRRLENSTDVWRTPPQYVDALHFWGSVEGRMLTEWGVKDIDDPDRYYEVDAVLIGGDVIRAELNDDPIGRRPYHTASYRPVPGSFWGLAIPELMLDTQAMCNACARAIEDNLAISSMPQVGINTDALPPGEDITGQTPGKVWTFRSKDDMGAQIPGDFIKWFSPPSNTAELLKVMEEFERRADDETGIPRYSYGNQNTYGAASALANYEPVITPMGAKAIGDVAVGDEVLTTYGDKAVVEGVFPQGVRPTFRVYFSDGRHVDCDMDHRWSVRTHHDRPFRTMTLQDIVEAGLFSRRKKSKKCPSGQRPKWMVPNIDAVAYSEKDLRVDPYTMGALLGDGDARCRLTSMDKEIFDAIPYPLGAEDHSNDSLAWAQTIMTIKEDYHSYGMNCDSLSKRIHVDYLTAGVHQRQELLRGLMDTDGCCTKLGNVFFSSSSRGLIEDVRMLVLSLGGSVGKICEEEGAEFEIRGRKCVRQKAYRICFKVPMEVLFKAKRKQNRYRKIEPVYTLITGVQYIGDHEVTCIKVSAKDRMFLCGNYIPTHNTASGLEMLMTAAAKGIRRAVGIIDEHVIQPALEMLFTYVMLFDDDATIKGDCKVVPRGTAALLIKSQIQQSRISFLQTVANPVLAPILGENGLRVLLEETARAMDLPVEKLFNEIERLKREAEMEAAKNAPPQPDPNVALKAQVDMAKVEQQKEESIADAAISLAQVQMQQQKDIREAANLSQNSKRPYPAKLK